MCAESSTGVMSVKENVHVLVTGGAGFLGNAVATALLDKYPRWRVSTLDIHTPSEAIRNSVHQHFEVDIRSSTKVGEALQGYRPDIVVHTAGIVPARRKRYSTSKADRDHVFSINVEGTKHILDATMAAGCKLFVYTSSCTAVTDDLDRDYHNIDESEPLGNARLHYGESKAEAERYVLSPELAQKGLKTCALRPSTIIGPGDTSVIATMADCIKKGETPFIVGDGNNLYDFIYIDNAAWAHVLAVENLLTTQTAAGEAFFVSNQEPVYFWDFLAYVWAQLGHHPKRRFYIPSRLAWVAGAVAEFTEWMFGTDSTMSRGSVKDGTKMQYANCRKAEAILGYKAEVGLAEGVRRACAVGETPWIRPSR